MREVKIESIETMDLPRGCALVITLPESEFRRQPREHLKALVDGLTSTLARKGRSDVIPIIKGATNTITTQEHENT